MTTLSRGWYKMTNVGEHETRKAAQEFKREEETPVVRGMMEHTEMSNADFVQWAVDLATYTLITSS